MNESEDENEEDDIDSVSVSSLSSNVIFIPRIANMKFAPISSKDIVELSHVDDDLTIYVRSTRHDVHYYNLLKLINGNTSQRPVLFKLNRDNVVLSKIDEDYSRAIIVDEDQLLVKFIDIGINMKAKFSDIQYMTAEMFIPDRMVTPINLRLPEKLTKNEKSAVFDYLKKREHNRFKIISENSSIVPNTNCDLIHITNNESLMEICMTMVEKKIYVENLPRKRVNREDVELYIVDNSHIRNGFVCCVLTEDMNRFTKKIADLNLSAESCEVPYVPEKLEICSAFYSDAENSPLWYMAQFQEILANEKAQVGLIDFGISVNVPLADIRKFDHRLDYEQLSIVGKLRNDDISLDLLDINQFENHMHIHATRVRASGDSHEIFLSADCFLDDDNFEEDILAIEDALN